MHASWTLELLQHQVRKPDEWRDYPPERRVPVRHTLQFADLIPLCTNGILAQCRLLGNDTIIEVHVSNLEWPKEERTTKQRATPTKRPKKQELPLFEL